MSRSQTCRTDLTMVLAIAVLVTLASQASAQPMPDAGWTTSLSTDAHGVSGTVTVVDQDTIRVDDFTYDGGGLVVFFYLGASDSSTDFQNGLPIGEDIKGISFDGNQPSFTVDLPSGETIDGYHAISVWCVEARFSFGSGTFMPVPEPSCAVLAITALSWFLGRRRARGWRLND